jgi:O-antigen/teichoic acid export membrane protein
VLSEFFKYKVVFKFLILFASQIIFYVSSLITTRLLLSYYGIDFLGEVSYFFVSISIINTILNYGLPLYGQLTINGSKYDELRSVNLFKSFLQIRIALFVVVVFLLLILSYQGVLKNNISIYLILYSLIYTFYIDWYLIGKENYVLHATSIFIGKGFQIVILLCFISLFKSPFLVYLLEIFSLLLVVVCSNFLSKSLVYYKAVFTKIDYTEIKLHFLKLSNSFLSFLGVAVYTTFNSWFLSYAISNRDYGFFSIADKYFLLINGVSAIFFRVYFLNNSSIYRSKLISVANLFLLLILPALSTLVAYLFKEKICILLFGYFSENISILINLFLVAYFFNQVCLIISNLLVIRGFDKMMQNTFLISAGMVLIGYLSIRFLNYQFTSAESIFLTIFGNLISALLLFYSLYKNQIWKSLNRLSRSI